MFSEYSLPTEMFSECSLPTQMFSEYNLPTEMFSEYNLPTEMFRSPVSAVYPQRCLGVLRSTVSACAQNVCVTAFPLQLQTL